MDYDTNLLLRDKAKPLLQFITWSSFFVFFSFQCKSDNQIFSVFILSLYARNLALVRLSLGHTLLNEASLVWPMPILMIMHQPKSAKISNSSWMGSIVEDL